MYEELKITHLHGPMELGLTKRDMVVLCVVRDGGAYVEDFIRHYLGIGASCIALLDNGSSDDTVEKACRFDRVVVLQSLVSFAKHKLGMRHAMTRLFGVGTWSLLVDIDEFFLYPYMDELALGDFIGYLNANRYTGVVSHLVDLFPDSTVGELLSRPIPSISTGVWHFDVDEVSRRDYDIASNRPTNPDIKLWSGGMRQRVFEFENGPQLTKHPVIFGDGRIIIHSSHDIGGRYLADISTVLLHYKYVGDVLEHARKAVSEENYYRQSVEYKRYLEIFEASPDRRIGSAQSIRYEGYETLWRAGVFITSESFERYADAARSRERGSIAP